MSSERYAINNDGATVYHHDPDCQQVNDTVSPRGEHYIESHDLDPCPNCAREDIPVWVATGNYRPVYHTTADCYHLDKAANIQPKSLAEVEHLDACESIHCEGEREQTQGDDRPCPHCGTPQGRKGWAMHVKHCDGGDGDE